MATMRSGPLAPPQIVDWLQAAHLHPNANWYAPVFDARRRGLFYITSRTLMLNDEPNLTISRDLERVLARLDRRDPMLRVLPQMPDEDRVKLILQFIVSRQDRDEREELLHRFARRPEIVFGWRPYSIEELVAPDEQGRETSTGREWREQLARACAVPVERALQRLGQGQVYAVSFN